MGKALKIKPPRRRNAANKRKQRKMVDKNLQLLKTLKETNVKNLLNRAN